MKRHWLVGLTSVVGTALASLLLYSSCGSGTEFNLFQPFAKPAAQKNIKYILEQARVDLDNKDYDGALNLLLPVINDSAKDSNEARVLYASAKVGSAQLDIWSVVSSLLTANDKASKSTSNGGINDVLNSITGTLLGTGQTRANKVQALYDAVDALEHAPDPADLKVANTACLMAAFLAVPTVADATTAMTDMQTALTQISAAATSGGTVCPNIGSLDTASAEIQTAAASFNYILNIAKTCSFLNLDQTAAAMNKIETALATLKKNVDKGCDALPTCPAAVPNCQNLLPTCVQQVLKVGTGAAKAGDGVISTCEIVLNCLDPTVCFAAF